MVHSWVESDIFRKDSANERHDKGKRQFSFVMPECNLSKTEGQSSANERHDKGKRQFSFVIPECSLSKTDGQRGACHQSHADIVTFPSPLSDEGNGKLHTIEGADPKHLITDLQHIARPTDATQQEVVPNCLRLGNQS